MENHSPLRVGAVNYLNTKPLVYGLAELAPWADVSFDLPSRLADGLSSGRFDVALIPSIEFFQDPSYSIPSNACIACRGPVLSVKLFGRTKIHDLKTLALDEGSRTSVALVRILLKQRFDIEPQLEPLPIGDTIDDTDADGVLLIGDRAIHSPPGRYAEIWDLGDQWCRWAERPFVFAMWVARGDVELQRLETALNTARDQGVKHLNEIAQREAASLAMTRPQCLAYLRDNLYFHLGPREQQGLELFYHHAAEMGLAPSGRNIEFAHSQSAG